MIPGVGAGSGEEFGAYELTEDDVEALRSTATAHAAETPLVRIRPHVDAEGFGGEQPERYARAFSRGPDAEAHTYAHEFWFADRALSVYVSTPDPDRLRDTIGTLYPHSDVETVDLAAAFPSIEAGEYAAAARLPLKRDSVFPIWYPGSTQARSADPLGALLPTAVNPRGGRVLIQTVFTPVGSEWFRRGVWGSDGRKIAESKAKGEVVGEVRPTVVESPTDKEAAKDMHRQRGRPAFTATVAVLTLSGTAAGAAERAAAVAAAFDEFDHDAAEQGFAVEPVHGSGVRDELMRVAARAGERRGRLKRWLFGEETVLTDRELGAVAHIPGTEVDVPELDRTDAEDGPGVPPDAPQHAPSDPAAERGPTDR